VLFFHLQIDFVSTNIVPVLKIIYFPYALLSTFFVYEEMVILAVTAFFKTHIPLLFLNLREWTSVFEYKTVYSLHWSVLC